MLGTAFRKVFGPRNELPFKNKEVNTSYPDFLDFRTAKGICARRARLQAVCLPYLDGHTPFEYSEQIPDGACVTATIAVETAFH